MKFIIQCLLYYLVILLTECAKRRNVIQFADTSRRKLVTELTYENINLGSYGAVYVDKKTNKLKLTNTKLEESDMYKLIAESHYHRVINETGWNKLSISTYKEANAYQQAYLAGYLEGRMSAEDIYNFYENLRINNDGDGNSFAQMYNFFVEVAESIKKKVYDLKKTANKLPYDEQVFWAQMIIGYTQLEGLVQGYNYEVNRMENKSPSEIVQEAKKIVSENSSAIMSEYDQDGIKVLQSVILSKRKGNHKHGRNQRNKRKTATNRHKTKSRTLTLADFLIIQADGEVPELMRIFGYIEPALRKGRAKLGSKNYFKNVFGIDTKDPLTFWSKLMWRSKCSAFIKVTKDDAGKWKDLLAGHATWTSYTELLRTYKHYNFELEIKGQFKRSEITFSSYPGTISSTDDYYITSNQLLVMETTIEIGTADPYKHVKKANEYIPNFMRVLGATRFAEKGIDWVNSLKHYNSGTYSSQWMILDYKQFNKIKGTQNRAKGILYMLEQTPGNIQWHDISDYLLDHSYFGSYNRAFLEETNADLQTALFDNLYHVNFLSYQDANRAKIFRNEESKVKDLKSLKDILRYNGYKKNNFEGDPSNNNAGDGISARYDLDVHFNLSGGIDVKVSNLELISKMTAIAVSGPTTENNSENLPVFDWKEIERKHSLSNQSRLGVPDKFDFPYVVMSPDTLKSPTMAKYDFE